MSSGKLTKNKQEIVIFIYLNAVKQKCLPGLKGGKAVQEGVGHGDTEAVDGITTDITEVGVDQG